MNASIKIRLIYVLCIVPYKLVVGVVFLDSLIYLSTPEASSAMRAFAGARSGTYLYSKCLKPGSSTMSAALTSLNSPLDPMMTKQKGSYSLATDSGKFITTLTIMFTHMSLASLLWDIDKLCRPRPDASECSV